MIFFCIPCLVLIGYFAVAGIFFPKYRGYIKEGWKCFIDKIKRRECSVSFDNKMRIKTATWLADKGMIRAGRFLYVKENFDWMLIVIGVVFTILSIYLFIVLMGFLVNPPCSADTCGI